MTALSPIPACILRMTCEDLAECVSDIPEELRTLLFSWESRSIESAWGSLTSMERAELAHGALSAEERCSQLLDAAMMF